MDPYASRRHLHRAWLSKTYRPNEAPTHWLGTLVLLRQGQDEGLWGHRWGPFQRTVWARSRGEPNLPPAAWTCSQMPHGGCFWKLGLRVRWGTLGLRTLVATEPLEQQGPCGLLRDLRTVDGGGSSPSQAFGSPGEGSSW